MRSARAVADRLLTVVAGLGVLCLLAAVAGPLFGAHVLFFRSGSMQPTIDTGSAALAIRVPVAEVAPGDIVSVRTPQGTRVTHRVVSRAGDSLVLKGDANASVDATPYRTATVERVVAHVPAVGYVVGWLTGPAGLTLLGLLGLGLLGLVVRPQLLGGEPSGTTADDAEPSGSRARRRRALLPGAGVLALVALSVVGPGQVRPGWAAPWTDPAAISGSTYAATVVGAPTLSCTVSVGSVRFDWTAVGSATGYRLHYGSGGATTEVVSSAVTTRTISLFGSGTFWVETLRAFPSVTWESVASNKKSYSITALVLASCTNA